MKNPLVKIGNYASYIRLEDEKDIAYPVKNTSPENGVLLDYDQNGKLVGIEIISELTVEYYGDYKKREENEEK